MKNKVNLDKMCVKPVMRITFRSGWYERLTTPSGFTILKLSPKSVARTGREVSNVQAFSGL